MTTRILIIEDEKKIAQILLEYFQQASFEVEAIHDGTFAVEKIKTSSPDFVVLDLMLPGKDGLKICKEVRQFSDVPILMLTARVDEIDRLIGLEIGADDYVCKPFSPREIVARVKTILRRVKNDTNEKEDTGQLVYNDILLLPECFQCFVEGEELKLTRVEFQLLTTLIKRPSRVFSRQILMESSYEDGRVVSWRTIDSHIKNLRQKLVSAGQREDLIRSIYGIGYKIE